VNLTAPRRDIAKFQEVVAIIPGLTHKLNLHRLDAERFEFE
jgi:hypothetical protein